MCIITNTLKLFVDPNNTIAVIERIPFSGHRSSGEMRSDNQNSQFLIISAFADFADCLNSPLCVVLILITESN